MEGKENCIEWLNPLIVPDMRGGKLLRGQKKSQRAKALPKESALPLRSILIPIQCLQMCGGSEEKKTLCVSFSPTITKMGQSFPLPTMPLE